MSKRAGRREIVNVMRGAVGAGLLLLLAPLLAGCGGGAPPTSTVTAESAKASAQYQIGPGDSLDIFVYHAPDLTVNGLPVRPDGRISIPLIPDIVAAGKTPTQLSKELEGKLAQYVRDPVVTVMVRSFVGPFDRQIRVIGEATDPAAIPYRDHMTVLDVMIATKGLTKFAAGNRAVIIRRLPDGKEETIHVHLDSLVKSGDISQNVEMQPGDTLIIPQTWF